MIGDAVPHLRYMQLHRRVRPARVATRIGRMDLGWEPTAMRMLENLSVTWGGAGHLIVPVDDVGTMHPELWPVVQLYDADQWAAYVNTPRGQQMANPAGFTAWLTKEARRWTRKNGGGMKNARELLSAEHLMTAMIGGWPPPEQFAHRIRRHTSPTSSDTHVFLATYIADGEPGQHLVNVADLDPLPDRVRILATEELPISLQILIATRVGALAPGHRKRLVDRGVSVDTLTVHLEDLGPLLRLAWLGNQRHGSWLLQQSLATSFGQTPRERPEYLAEDFLESTPMALSKLGCSEFSRWHPGQDSVPLTVVVGTHVDDFSYAFCLQRCGVPALWLPGEFAVGDDELSRAVRETLAECLGNSGGQKNGDVAPILRSLSLTADDLTKLRNRLQETVWGSNLRIDVGDRTATLPPHRVLTIMDRLRFDDPIDVPFSGDSMVGGCPVVTPSPVSSLDPWKLKWWVDIDVPGHPLPGRTVLNETVVAGSSGWQATARSRREGISFLSHQMGFALAGASLDQLLERPRLRLPSAFTIFERLAAEGGLTMAESSAGRFRRLTLDLWGGLRTFAMDLNEESTRRLIGCWLSEDPSGSDPGVFTNSRRRFLSLEDAQGASGLASEATRALVDRYLGMGVLRRGLILQCSHCRLTDWYEMGQLGQSFECRRCRSRTLLTAGSWKGQANEPAFYYDLAEVAYQALRNNVQVPVAALYKLQSEAKSFLDLSEVELTNTEGTVVEIDILAIVDGRIVLGEVKTSDLVAKTNQGEMLWLQKFRSAAEALTADEVVFATAAPNWRKRTVEHIHTVFDDMNIVVRLLEQI